MMKFKAVFDWKKPCALRKDAKQTMESVLIEAYNRFSEEINKHLDVWNKEWDEKYKSQTLYKDYDSFIHERYENTLKWMKENDQTFKMVVASGGIFGRYGFYIGEEFELHLTLSTGFFYSINVEDVSFHLEEA